jgi:uncharacterized protein YutE (UPF0331/DUF86 family)
MAAAPDARKYLWDERRHRVSIRDHRRGINGLRRATIQTAASLPNLPRIIAFRNVLIHGYALIDDRLVSDVITRDFLGLLAILLQLLPTETP